LESSTRFFRPVGLGVDEVLEPQPANASASNTTQNCER
jgi:hypothetical protein